MLQLYYSQLDLRWVFLQGAQLPLGLSLSLSLSLSASREVIITGRRGDFGDACERAMKGEENDGVIRGGLKRPQKSSQYGLCLLWS